MQSGKTGFVGSIVKLKKSWHKHCFRTGEDIRAKKLGPDPGLTLPSRPVSDVSRPGTFLLPGKPPPFLTTKPGLETLFSVERERIRKKEREYNRLCFKMEKGREAPKLKLSILRFSSMHAVKPANGKNSISAEIKRILVVDDEPEFVKTVQRHLRREGFFLETASDGKMARERIESSCSENIPIQLVITDVLMPRMDGIELMRWIRDSHPEISVLAVSGFTDTIMSEKIIRPEMDEYCQKPFTPRKMMVLLGKISDKRRSVGLLEA